MPMKITVNQSKQLIDLVQENSIVGFFEKLDLFGVKDHQAKHFRSEFIFGRFNYDFYDRLQVYANSLAEIQFTFEKKQPKYDLFFSFSSKNKNEAEQIVIELRKAGITVFFSTDLEEQAGQDFGSLIRNALTNSTHFMLYCTPQAIISKWVKYECETFFHYYVESDKTRRFFILEGTNFSLDLIKNLNLQSIQTSKNVGTIVNQLSAKYEIQQEKTNISQVTHNKPNNTDELDEFKTLQEKINSFVRQVFQRYNILEIYGSYYYEEEFNEKNHNTRVLRYGKTILLEVSRRSYEDLGDYVQETYDLIRMAKNIDKKDKTFRMIVVNSIGQYGCIDFNMIEVIPCIYISIEPFSEGLAVCRRRVKKRNFLSSILGLNNDDDDDKFGFIDINGQEVIPCQYERATPFYKGFAEVTDVKGNNFFIDKTGKKVKKED
jgi:hypothetical protein